MHLHQLRHYSATELVATGVDVGIAPRSSLDSGADLMQDDDDVVRRAYPKDDASVQDEDESQYAGRADRGAELQWKGRVWQNAAFA